VHRPQAQRLLEGGERGLVVVAAIAGQQGAVEVSRRALGVLRAERLHQRLFGLRAVTGATQPVPYSASSAALCGRAGDRRGEAGERLLVVAAAGEQAGLGVGLVDGLAALPGLAASSSVVLILAVDGDLVAADLPAQHAALGVAGDDLEGARSRRGAGRGR
jgi:hypothetical protein